jgi:hypothetical protein
VGAAIVLISAWLNWGDFQGETASAYEIGSEFLFDSSVEEGKGLLGIGYLVLLAAVLVVVGVFVKQVRFLPIAGGVLAVIVPLLFVFQANNFIDNANDEFDLDIELFDFITYFPFLTVIAGGIAIAGGAVALAQKR